MNLLIEDSNQKFEDLITLINNKKQYHINYKDKYKNYKSEEKILIKKSDLLIILNDLDIVIKHSLSAIKLFLDEKKRTELKVNLKQMDNYSGDNHKLCTDILLTMEDNAYGSVDGSYNNKDNKENKDNEVNYLNTQDRQVTTTHSHAHTAEQRDFPVRLPPSGLRSRYNNYMNKLYSVKRTKESTTTHEYQNDPKKENVTKNTSEAVYTNNNDNINNKFSNNNNNLNDDRDKQSSVYPSRSKINNNSESRTSNENQRYSNKSMVEEKINREDRNKFNNYNCNEHKLNSDSNIKNVNCVNNFNINNSNNINITTNNINNDNLITEVAHPNPKNFNMEMEKPKPKYKTITNSVDRTKITSQRLNLTNNNHTHDKYGNYIGNKIVMMPTKMKHIVDSKVNDNLKLRTEKDSASKAKTTVQPTSTSEIDQATHINFNAASSTKTIEEMINNKDYKNILSSFNNSNENSFYNVNYDFSTIRTNNEKSTLRTEDKGEKEAEKKMHSDTNLRSYHKYSNSSVQQQNNYIQQSFVDEKYLVRQY